MIEPLVYVRFAYLCRESVKLLRAALYHMPNQRRCGRYTQQSAMMYAARVESKGSLRDAYWSSQEGSSCTTIVQLCLLIFVPLGLSNTDL